MENTTAARGTEHGFIVGHTAGGGQALHIIPRNGAGWNDLTTTAVCGTVARERWSGIFWIQSGDAVYPTPAEAAAAHTVCRRCAAAAARMAAAEVPAPAESPADTRAAYLAELSAPGSRRVNVSPADNLHGTRGGARADVVSYWTGTPGRESCIDSVLITVTGGGSHSGRAIAALRAMERLAAARVSHVITAGQYQTIATGSPDGATLFVFGTWEND